MPKKKKAAAVSAKIQLRNARRAQAVEVVRRGEPVSVVAHIVRVPLCTVFHWVARWLGSRLWSEIPAMLGAINEPERSLAEEGGVPVEDVRKNLHAWITV